MTRNNSKFWIGRRWDGCRIPPSNIQRSCATPRGDDLPDSFGWQDCAVPTINQHGPSCCGQAWANWMEMMVRRYIGHCALKDGEQIDGYEIWKRGRELFNGGDLSGGLFLEQGYAAACDLGILPPGSILLDMRPVLEDVAAQLRLTPLVQGHIVADGWWEPNPDNGGLDESKPPKPGDGGHATCMIGITNQNNKLFIVSQNSWGEEYGLYGYFIMTWHYWTACYLGSGPCAATLPSGWESWNGWRNYVTRNAQ